MIYYNNFKKIENLTFKLLNFANILENKKIIIQIDNYPDYNMSETYSGVYIFSNKWNFSHLFKSIFETRIRNIKIFHFDDIERLAEEHNELVPQGHDFSEFLNKISQKFDVMRLEGIEPDIDNFKMVDFKTVYIDNTSKYVEFRGSYRGSQYEIQPDCWNILFEYEVTGTSVYIDENKFYLELLSESYAFHKIKSYKIAFFLAYTALESYINHKLNSDDVEKRLKEKINELFNLTFPDDNIGTHQIYSSIMVDYKKITNTRNNISHGRSPVALSGDDVIELLNFVLIIILSIEHKISNFAQFRDLIA